MRVRAAKAEGRGRASPLSVTFTRSLLRFGDEIKRWLPTKEARILTRTLNPTPKPKPLTLTPNPNP